ncbi:RRT5 [Candida theae]|uniref:RRT5 n=1 Tax=Candida theae TaxID=1198502 RepID=A0AAD5BG67_9ASCO|nr:RRT5 [Candida theae]KAI5959691.1 RRT5 [Candida theae]
MSGTRLKPPYRVYIKNLHYAVTEEDLYALFEKYRPVAILVPTYTIRFSKSGRRKPFGFAYVELAGPEQVEAAVKEFDGKSFHGKTLTATVFQPYNPQHRFWLDGTSLVTPTPRVQSNAPNAESNAEPNAQTSNANVTPNGAPVVVPVVVPVDGASSTGKILISKIRGEITYSEIEDFFSDYNFNDISICRHKTSIVNPLTLTGSYYSAIITVDTSTKSVDEIIEALKPKKFMGKRVKLKPATTKQATQVERDDIFANSIVQNDEQQVTTLETQNKEHTFPAEPTNLESPDPTSMIVSPGSTQSSNFNARINSP